MTGPGHGLVLFLLLVASTGATAQPGTGWRGNGTGLWPDAKVPLEWYRLPRGIATHLKYAASKPARIDEATTIKMGLIRDWLVLGPFALADSLKDFDREPLAELTSLEPTQGMKVGELSWKPLSIKLVDRFSLGEVELPSLDLASAVGGFKNNQAAYAHTYVHAPRAGKVQVIVQHGQGLKVWLNGRVVYREPERRATLGSYAAISKHELHHLYAPAPRFVMELQPGSNRLLLKVCTPPRAGHTEMRACLRLMDPPDVAYDSKNIMWMTELPQRSNATPILVGDRIFVMAEPDQLLCLDRMTGRIMWTASHSYYDALSQPEKDANPAFKTQIDPMLAALAREKDFIKRVILRGQIHEALLKIDARRFELKADGHFESHFGIVGFTTPTPVSDGKHVYVWCGNGVAACYDLDGKRQWITRLEVDELSYSSTPALVDGVLAVFLGRLIGLDAQTGKVRWQQRKVIRNIAAVLPARIAGTAVFVTQGGFVVRASDGEILFRTRLEGGDTGWAPPVILDDVVYLPKYGVTNLIVLDFNGARGEQWVPKISSIALPGEVSRRPNGGWIDRWTAGSPLVLDGLAYLGDIYASFYVLDLHTKKMVYRRDLDLSGLFHYNALPVAASLTLMGNHILALDNQGTTLVLQPGREFRQVARNRLATQLDRWWPVPAQEILCNAPPVTDGRRLYLRGERYLYCIGQE